MRAKKQKINKLFITATIALGNLLFVVPYLTSAQANQDASLDINTYYNWETPRSLELPQMFINELADTWIYKAYNPSNIDEYIKVYDLRNNGGFSVTLDVSDFKQIIECPSTSDIPPCYGTGIIPYTDLGIVTLANADQPESVDTPGVTSFPNSPPGTDSNTVFSTLDCDVTGSEDFQTTCEPLFQNFTGTGTTSDAQTIIDGSSPTATGRVGQYWLALGLRLRVAPTTPPGNYESTFTFSLTPEP